jgi:hypothetical protein
MAKPETAEQRKQFEEMHAKGAERYGTMWLQANESAVDMLSQIGIVPHQNRLLGTSIALKLCIWRNMGIHEGKKEAVPVAATPVVVEDTEEEHF